MLTQAHTKQFSAEGYTVVSSLFSAEETAFYNEHYEAMRQREVRIDENAATSDPLTRYPRLMQPHRRDEVSLRWLLDDRLNQCLTGLLGKEPYAVQTMFYFKPAGGRGQALHQDQYYLRVQPGTCMAAWMALDVIDEENGCLQVIPGSHTWPLLCTVKGDTRVSFTDVTVELPEGETPVPVRMQPGDVLFFNGQLVHGSTPNTSKDRFRRSLIGHYIVDEAEQVYRWYHPALRMDGTPVELGVSEAGGTCGVWVDEYGQQVVEMQAEVVNEIFNH